MKITIENRQTRLKIRKRPLRRVAQKILSVSGCPDAQLSILIVDDAMIREINRDYLAKDRRDVQYAVKEICLVVSKPRQLGWEKVKRLASYSLANPRFVCGYGAWGAVRHS